MITLDQRTTSPRAPMPIRRGLSLMGATLCSISLLLGATLTTISASAQSSASTAISDRSSSVSIKSTTISGTTLNIGVQNFGNWPLTVKLDGVSASTVNYNPGAQTIAATFGSLPPTGTYQLIVSKSNGSPAAYADVALGVGSAGPQGPKGDKGDNGLPGTGATVTSEPAGANCPAGGFKLTDGGGNISYICNPPVVDGDLGNGNTAEGKDALKSLTTGENNTANGHGALSNNATGHNNTASGYNSLFWNTTGEYNTATGFQALFSNITGSGNTANGLFALSSNTTGNDNTANGLALNSNTTGSRNTANGNYALSGNTTGNDNTANGFGALAFNTTATGNTANGAYALYFNTGDNNTANGHGALSNNTTGNSNTADGMGALRNNTTGAHNTANGVGALASNTTGTRNIALGPFAGLFLTTGSDNIDIGNYGVPDESATIRIGSAGLQAATFIAGISGATVDSGSGTPVVVDANGKLGTVLSSRRFKEDIKPMDKASEAILALNPVTFRYKREFDPKGRAQFGLIAEEVEKVSPDLVVYDGSGKVLTVRYEAVNAMLLEEFLKEHNKVEEQGRAIAELKAIAAEQRKALEELTALAREQRVRIQAAPIR